VSGGERKRDAGREGERKCERMKKLGSKRQANAGDCESIWLNEHGGMLVGLNELVRLNDTVGVVRGMVRGMGRAWSWRRGYIRRQHAGGVEIVDVKVEGSVVCVGGEMRGMVDAVRVGLVTYLYVFGSRRRAAGGQ
jgi:hypothetical protein